MIFFLLLTLFSFASVNACEMPPKALEAIDVRAIDLEQQQRLLTDLDKDESTALAAAHTLIDIVKICIEKNDSQGITLLNKLISHKNKTIKAYGYAYLGYVYQTGTMNQRIDYKEAHRLYVTAYPALDSNLDRNLKIFITYNSGLLFYEGGAGIEEDYEKAAKHFELVIARTQPTDPYHIISQYLQGMIHYSQDNLQQALNHLLVAEPQTTLPEISLRATATIGTIYQTPGPLFNAQKALPFLQKAANQSEYPSIRTQAAYLLALLYSVITPKKQLTRQYALIALENMDDEAKKQELEKFLKAKRRKPNPRNG